MAALGEISSIISIIDLSSKLVKYINSAVDATDDKRRLRREIREVETILRELQDEYDASEEGKKWAETIKTLKDPGAPLGRLSIMLKMLEVKVQPKHGFKKAISRLRWPFEEKEVDEIIATIEREKSLLNLALENNSRKLLQQIKKTTIENEKQLKSLIETIQKTSQEDEQKFSELIDDLSTLRSNVQTSFDAIREYQNNQTSLKEHSIILDWLSPMDYSSQQNDLIGRREPGTGQWLLDSPEFETWVETKGQALFCPGIPGAGKTILASIVVEHLMKQAHSNTGVAYLYCNFRRQDEQSATDLLGNVLKQLTRGIALLPSCVQSLYEKHKNRQSRPTWDEISHTCKSMACLYSRVFLVVDALDECRATDGCRNRLLSDLRSLQNACGVNLLVTSRFIPEVTRMFQEDSTLEIRANEEDLRNYLEARVSHLPAFVKRSPDLQEEVKSEIIKAIDGMFLLAKLHLDSLIGKRSVKALRVALDALPRGSKAYDQAYNDALERIESQVEDQVQLAKQALSWITRAGRQLSTLELQHALAVEVGQFELDQDNITDVQDIVTVCAGLVTVDEQSNIIRLVHYTAQEYLARTWQTWFPDADFEITTICATYLLFNVFRKSIEATSFHPRKLIPRSWFSQLVGKRRRANPLFSYAATNWGWHAQKIQEIPQALTNFLRAAPNVESSVQEMFLSEFELYPQVQNLEVRRNGLHMAAYFGLKDALSSLVDMYDPESEDRFGHRPLHLAAKGGHTEVMKFLIEVCKVGTGWTSKEGETPLDILVKYGHDASLRFFLETGAMSANGKATFGQSPLVAAARYGHESVCKTLLAHGAHVNDALKINRSSTALYEAVLEDHEGVVRVLLAVPGIEVNIPDILGKTPFFLAVNRGRQAITELLLENPSVDVNLKDVRGRAPLSWAAAAGNHNFVEQMLRHPGINVNTRDMNGETPLSWTISCKSVDNDAFSLRLPVEDVVKGKLRILEILLTAPGLEVDLPDKKGQTPLFKAVVLMIRNLGASHRDSPKVFLAPFALSAIRLLKNHGAKGKLVDRYGRSPLDYVIEKILT